MHSLAFSVISLITHEHANNVVALIWACTRTQWLFIKVRYDSAKKFSWFMTNFWPRIAINRLNRFHIKILWYKSTLLKKSYFIKKIDLLVKILTFISTAGFLLPKVGVLCQSRGTLQVNASFRIFFIWFHSQIPKKWLELEPSDLEVCIFVMWLLMKGCVSQVLFEGNIL